MANVHTHKLLGRSRPSATTNTTIYTAPASTTTLVTSLFVVNTSATSTTARIFVVNSGGSAGVSNAVYYNVNIPGNDTLLANAVPVLAASDFLVVYATLATLTFTASGVEIT